MIARIPLNVSLHLGDAGDWAVTGQLARRRRRRHRRKLRRRRR